MYLPNLIWHKIKEYIFGNIINIKAWYYIKYFRKYVIRNMCINNMPNLLTCNKKSKIVKINNKFKNFYYQNLIIWRIIKKKNKKYIKKYKIKIVSIR